MMTRGGSEARRPRAKASWGLSLLLLSTPACAQHREPTPPDARARMVAEQLVPRGITDSATLAAMGAVPRHEFVPPEMRPYAYQDTPLPIGLDQTISQPYIVALMTQLIRPEPGLRVLEVGAARCWGALHLVPRGVEYVATDILADPVIGLGRGAFYERHVGPFERVQADGENLPFASGSFDLVYCVASLHHALDARRMLKEMARVTRRGGVVAALNEGTRAPGASEDNPQQESEKAYGINEHVHTMWAYVAAFLAAGVAITRLEQAEGYDMIGRRRRLRHVLRVPLVGRTAATLLTQNLSEYSGITIFGRKVL